MIDEGRRIDALKGYGILDTPNEPEFDRIVQEAAAMLGAPIALISLVDEHRQWFKAKLGLEPDEMPRSISFCTHAIHGSDMMVVEDAAEDARFAANPLVTGDPGIRFYAGTPLKNVFRCAHRDALRDRQQSAPSADPRAAREACRIGRKDHRSVRATACPPGEHAAGMTAIRAVSGSRVR